MSNYNLDMWPVRTQIRDIGKGTSWAALVRPFNRPSEASHEPRWFVASGN